MDFKHISRAKRVVEPINHRVMRSVRTLRVRYRWTIYGLLFAMLTIIVGCPNPLNYLVFEQDGKLKNNIQLKQSDIPLNIKISGYAYYFDSGDYDLSLDFQIKKKSKSSSLVIRPDAIRIWYYDQEMTFKDTTTWNSHNPKKGKYAFSAHFKAPPLFDRLPRSDDGKFKDVRLRIVLDGFLIFNNVPLRMDTVIAWERKAYLFSDQLK
jgi:hypothetical protein